MKSKEIIKQIINHSMRKVLDKYTINIDASNTVTDTEILKDANKKHSRKIEKERLKNNDKKDGPTL